MGAKGRDLITSSNGTGAANINQLADPYLAVSSQLVAKVPNPFFNNGGTGVIGSSTVALNQLLRPFPEFSSVNIVTSGAKSLYNALNVKLQKRLSQGVSVLATYTWASNWDSAWGTNNNLNGNTPGLPQDASNLNAEYSRALDDIPQRLAVGATLALPFRQGMGFLSGHRVLGKTVDGWSLNIVGLVQTGMPLAVIQKTNNNADVWHNLWAGVGVMGGFAPQAPQDLSLFLPEWMVFVLAVVRGCRTMEKLDRRIGQRRDATRAPSQARSGWRPSGRLLELSDLGTAFPKIAR